MKTLYTHWKSAFLTGLAIVLPAAVSIGIVVWLFGTVAKFTDTLLLLVPKAWTHSRNGEGPTHLYWSLAALVVAILLVGLVGRLAHYYFGKKMIRVVDLAFMRVPLLNKIYGALKQIKEAFTANRTATFKQVVLVEFPRAGLFSVGFVTSTQNDEVLSKVRESLLSVFVPTPPLTSGSIILVPEAHVVKLDMSVAEGIKFVMSLGSVSPAYTSTTPVNGADSSVANPSYPPMNGRRLNSMTPSGSTQFNGDDTSKSQSHTQQDLLCRARPSRIAASVKEFEPIDQKTAP